jgi:hypothetical protein
MARGANQAGGRASELEGQCDSTLGECAQEIDRAQWQSFFQRFSKEHQGARVDVEVRGADSGGAGQLASGMPLTGITADIRQVGQKQQPQVEVILGGDAEGHLTHIIAAPQRVWRQSEGHSELVQIVDAAGVTTAIHLSA